MEVGSTTFTIVSHFGTPRAYEASRSSFGTRRSISSVERMTMGIISTHRAMEAEKPLKALGPTMSANREKAKRPATIDGMPVMTSTRKVIARRSGLVGCAYSTR